MESDFESDLFVCKASFRFKLKNPTARKQSGVMYVVNKIILRFRLEQG
jgi:hypothetical protein